LALAPISSPSGATPVAQAAPGLRFAARRADIEDAIARVFDRGTFILGEEVEAFEAEFAAYLGTDHAVGVSSGTDALRITLAALAVGPGDEVVTVAMTAVATASAIESVGAKPVFVDIDHTRCMDPAALEAAISPATAAILPVHLHGHPAPMERIMRIAERRGLAVVEDCAQSHGASIDGKRTGTFGHAAAFSFYPTKNLGAAGDAGAIVTNDPALAARVRRLRQYGFDETQRCVGPGWNGRLDELQAAILRVLLPDLDAQNEERRALAAHYRSRLAGAALGLPPEHDGAVFHQFAVAVKNRDEIRQRLAMTHNIGTGLHYALGIHQHPHFVRVPCSLPVTERLARETLSLPIQPEVASGCIERIADALLESMNACRS
jgi:dTDP-3-amino-3,4,6-trideoxy-alpha-D-glucose transaminase